MCSQCISRRIVYKFLSLLRITKETQHSLLSDIDYFRLDNNLCWLRYWLDCSVICCDLVIIFFFTDHQRQQKENIAVYEATPSPVHLLAPLIQLLWPLGYETSTIMAGWYRITAVSSLLQVGLILLLLSAWSTGMPQERCINDKTCEPQRPPVVLSKCLIAL